VDDKRYEQLVVDAFRHVLDLFQDVDPDDADVEPSGDVIRIALRDGGRVVLNTQRPVHQLWLAGGQRAWHFSYDDVTGGWLDDKGRGELFAILRELTSAAFS
jgi:CyaY protein